MLQLAIERWGAIRVQLKCDARNIQSQRAIERLGACREGVDVGIVERSHEGVAEDVVDGPGNPQLHRARRACRDVEGVDGRRGGRREPRDGSDGD